MDRLEALSSRRIAETTDTFRRYLYDEINWDNRLIVIKGAKGVGKTTMMLQHIKECFPDLKKVIYASLDHLWFSTHDLLELAEYFYTHGGTHMFLDEVHMLKNWQRQIKNIYDYYPKLHIVITGSSLLKIDSISADLSRRRREYTLQGMSFREFLKLEGIADFPVLKLEEILSDHLNIAVELSSQIKVLPYFERYLRQGYYPFYREEGDGYEERIQKVVEETINSDMPAVSNLEYSSIYKIKQLLSVISEQNPFTIDLTSLSKILSTTRNTLLKMFELLEKGALIRRLYSASKGMGMLSKPEKLLFNNSNLIYALSDGNIGTVRESFFANQLSEGHEISMPETGDFVVDDKFLFEIGGKNKGFAQIRNIENSFVVRDGIEIGSGNKIPLWIFGLLY